MIKDKSLRDILNDYYDKSLGFDGRILHIGSGKVPHSFLKESVADENYYLKKDSVFYHVDSSYYNSSEGILNYLPQIPNNHIFICDDIFNFLDKSPTTYDFIIANRIFEHMFYDSGQVGRLLSSCYSVMEPSSKMVIIVPNHNLLAKRLIGIEQSLDDKLLTKDVLKDVLLVNTEFCNTRSDPHGSIWTPELAKLYIEQEGVFQIEGIIKSIYWQGRDCYMMIILRKK